ncbi:hypothetical protein BGZ94_004970, partial [Podila epigama]
MATMTTPRTYRKSLLWSLLSSLLLLTISLSSFADAALDPGFCGDCQTYAIAVGACGGTFTKADIEINGPYNLVEAQAKCVCTGVMQQVLWTCRRCELLAGFNPSPPAPNAHRSTCMRWGVTVDEYNAPYTGP